MTKQQAFELAEQEVTSYTSVFEKYNRAMEIYAAAFAKWTDGNYFLKENEDGSQNWMHVSAYGNDTYTIAELITKFEKQ